MALMGSVCIGAIEIAVVATHFESHGSPALRATQMADLVEQVDWRFPGIPVVIASRVPGGRIIGNPPDDFPVIYSYDLPAHKARILLMLALTQSTTKIDIERCFTKY